MPEKHQCLRLATNSCKAVSEQIVNLCCKYHHRQSVISIINNEEEAEPKTFHDLKQRYILPSSIHYDVLEECLAIWKKLEIKKAFPSLHLDIISILINYFCLDKNSKWSYEFRANGETSMAAELLILLNPNLTKLTISVSLDESLLEKLLSIMSNVNSLCFKCPIRDELFPVIGKYCVQLNSISIESTSVISEESAMKLCFEDFPQNTTKNAICSTLQFIDADITEESFLVLLENVILLKGMSFHRKFNYKTLVFSAAQNGKTVFPCNMESAVINNSADIPIDYVYRDYPKVKCLSVQFFRSPETLISNPNVVVLFLVGVSRPQIFEFTTMWTNLIKLVLIYFGDVDVSTISSNCPNLKQLSLVDCRERESQESEFRILEELILQNQSLHENLVVLRQASATLKKIQLLCELNVDTFEEMPAFETLMSMGFPCLEFLQYLPEVRSTKDVIVNFLNHFLKLKTFGVLKDANLISEVEQECVNRNWNLAIAKTSTIFPSFDEHMYCQ